MQNTLIDNSTGNLSMTSILRRCIAAERLEAEGVVAEDVYDNTGMPIPVNHDKSARIALKNTLIEML